MKNKSSELKTKITANLEFSKSGYLKAVYINAETDGEQAMIERALNNLFKPGCFSWIKRLFKR